MERGAYSKLTAAQWKDLLPLPRPAFSENPFSPMNTPPLSLLCECFPGDAVFTFPKNNVRITGQKYYLSLILVYIMGKQRTVLLPAQQRLLDTVGENIRLARLRRDLSTAQVAERAGISRTTLHKVETGDSGAAIGTYLKVLFVLNLEKDLLKLAGEDPFGRTLQDIALVTRGRASKTRKSR
jgi:DNA-binding XRE family transcriptional regulator